MIAIITAAMLHVTISLCIDPSQAADGRRDGGRGILPRNRQRQLAAQVPLNRARSRDVVTQQLGQGIQRPSVDLQ